MPVGNLRPIPAVPQIFLMAYGSSRLAMLIHSKRPAIIEMCKKAVPATIARHKASAIPVNFIEHRMIPLLLKYRWDAI